MLHTILHDIKIAIRQWDEWLDLHFGDYTDKQFVILKQLDRELQVQIQLSKLTGDFTACYEILQKRDNILSILQMIN
jgi:hypothetical protein